MEGQVPMMFGRSRYGVRGQVAPIVALVLSALVILVMAALSYSTLTARVMRALAAGEQATHAGAMQIMVMPDGTYRVGEGAATVRRIFAMHNLPYARLTRVVCALDREGRPFCEARIAVQGLFWAPKVEVSTRSVLPYGVTREGQ